MEAAKKIAKEKRIIDAASQVLADVGFANARMDDIAKAAGITKVTLYSYFESKDNLYMAIMYRAFQALTDNFYDTVNRHKDQSGLDATIAILNSFIEFCDSNYLFAEAILDYFSMIRKISREEKLGHGKSQISQSIYFAKLQDLQNLPLKLTVKEMERGIVDGSIRSDINCMLHAIHGWTVVVGYIKLISATPQDYALVLNVNLKSLKSLSLDIARKALAT